MQNFNFQYLQNSVNIPYYTLYINKRKVKINKKLFILKNEPLYD